VFARIDFGLTAERRQRRSREEREKKKSKTTKRERRRVFQLGEGDRKITLAADGTGRNPQRTIAVILRAALQRRTVEGDQFRR
jgi:hypothetical protein